MKKSQFSEEQIIGVLHESRRRETYPNQQTARRMSEF